MANYFVKKLCVEVILSAVDDYLGNPNKSLANKLLHEDAAKFLFSGDRDKLDFWCRALSVHPETIRRGVLHMKEEGLTTVLQKRKAREPRGIRKRRKA